MTQDKPSGLDLDTAAAVLVDIETTIVPWMRLRSLLKEYSSHPTQLNLANPTEHPYAGKEVTELLAKIEAHVTSCSARINDRLEKNSYHRVM